ncbi:MAG TPA: hypothetical protein VL475_15565, partial [Planctomycetaceae bacterium]|nr:hypothetical protein [Planctomycetaceae bacterium]
FQVDREPISYSSSQLDDPVARLQQRLDRGETQLRYDRQQGYLKSVLEQLSVPISSQGLVFSKTSFQRDRISPETPRALYFGDDVYVGWVQRGEVVELSAVDSQKGAVFYTLSQQPDDPPRFRRQTHECLQCHESSLTQQVPGHLVRSVYPDPRGQPMLSAGTFISGHQSPLRERWGGWYVTGTHGRQVHMGNLIVRDRKQAEQPEKIDLTAGSNCTDLVGRCDPTPYLSPHSDIVALMVLEHQTQMHNLLTRANYQTRLALRDEVALSQALGRPAGERLDSTRSRIRSVGEPLVRYLLFADEAPLSEPVAGTSDFVREFSARGPRDRQGRSLRDFDLQRRMFRYPLSYLIYSAAFELQPEPLKDYVYGRLWQILQGEDASGRYSNLTVDDRRAILEILKETKPNLPDSWRR